MKSATRRMTQTQASSSIITTRIGEFFSLLFSSFVMIAGLWLVYQAKSSNPQKTEFDKVQELIKTKQLINLNAVGSKTDLLGKPGENSPLSEVFTEYQDQITVANLIVDHLADLKKKGAGFERFGMLSAIRINRSDIECKRELAFLRQRLQESRRPATIRPIRERLKKEIVHDPTKLEAARTDLAKANDLYTKIHVEEARKRVGKSCGDSNSGEDKTPEGIPGKLITPLLELELKDNYEQAKATEKNAPPGFFQQVASRLLLQRRDQPKDLSLISYSQAIRLKPHFIVRDPAEFRSSLIVWAALMILVFYLIHFFWKFTRFRCDQIILPVIHLLVGSGFVMMVSLRDLLRDQLLFKSFAQGVILGGVGMLVTQLAFHFLRQQKGRFLSPRLSSYFPKTRLILRASTRVFMTLASHITDGLKTRLPRLYSVSDFLARPIIESPAALIPLSLAVLLATLLFFFGSAPGEAGEQGVKVNLGEMQPVEMIKILVIVFLAGYFDALWRLIRDLNQKGETPLSAVMEKIGIPRLRYFLPVVCAMGLILLFLFAIKDLGPALVLALTFLSLYFIVRSKPGLIIGGLGIFVGIVALGYTMQTPMTVYKRIQLCFSPWGNGLPGGDQIAHSLWAFGAGGVTGTGMGLGDPSLIPAGHTDLILSSFGEELGFFGLAAISILYMILIQRGLRAARMASNLYLFFLAVGLTLITVWQILLISCGILGLVPLSGVVSPFLSFGKSSMVANFIIFGLLISISATGRPDPITKPFRAPLKVVTLVLMAISMIVMAKVGYIQTIGRREILIKEALAKSEGGHYFQHNPRLDVARRMLPMGTVYDRNGIPLASSDWKEIEKFRDKYRELRVPLDKNYSRSDDRHYPFGDELFYLLGMANRPTKFEGGTSRNANYLEDKYDDRLHGYNAKPDLVSVQVLEYDELADKFFLVSKDRLLKRDYHELLPLLLYRNNPDREEVKTLLNRNRDIKLSIDVAYQLEVSRLLGEGIKNAGQEQGGAVVINAETGEVLVSASYPLIPRKCTECDGLNKQLDRAQKDKERPGSAFKVLTAIAAARKDPSLLKAYDCRGKVKDGQGNIITDMRDHVKPARYDFTEAMSLSSNVYFAQLGLAVGEHDLVETAQFFEIDTNYDNKSPLKVKRNLAYASIGLEEVKSNPLEMARVAATIANNGEMPPVRFALDDQREPSIKIINKKEATKIAEAMRKVVTEGTAKEELGETTNIAGKTGTADVDVKINNKIVRLNNGWFIGFSPYKPDGSRKIAFAVMIPKVTGHGAKVAAPIAKGIVDAAPSRARR